MDDSTGYDSCFKFGPYEEVRRDPLSLAQKAVASVRNSSRRREPEAIQTSVLQASETSLPLLATSSDRRIQPSAPVIQQLRHSHNTPTYQNGKLVWEDDCPLHPEL